MCGICGFHGPVSDSPRETLARMNAAITRRGPDEEGFYTADGIGLAMRRLSILDLAGGQQPVFNEDGRICAVFNGEIYNYRALRRELQEKGHRFRSESDTEVLVHLYEEHGEHLVHRLEGMFAFAIWDSPRRRLVLARDRLGIKPLFYAEQNGVLLFGSEIKALLAAGTLRREIDWQAVDSFFAYTYIPAPRTVFRGIHKLEPATLLVADSNGIRRQRYWDVDFSRQDWQKPQHEWQAEFERLLRRAVRSHLVADVPLGALLSGGIDSSLVVAMMSEATADSIESFTVGFDGANQPLRDERPYAKTLSGFYPVNYNETTVTPAAADIIGEIVEAFDEPFADDSVIPSYYVFAFARKKVKVALSGLGGDELFAGYHRYKGLHLSQTYARVPGWVHERVVHPLVSGLPEPSSGSDVVSHVKRFSRSARLEPAARYADYLTSVPAEERRQLYRRALRQEVDTTETAHLVTRHFDACPSDSLVDKALYTDLKTYLPDDILALSDRLSMWHSLELRVPLVDHALVEASARLPSRYKLRSGEKKYLLKRIARRWLPEAIVEHRKQGFEAPMGAWLRHDLADTMQQLLSRERIERDGFFDAAFIQRKVEEHLTGRSKNNKLLFSLMMFNAWFDRYAA